MLKIHLTTRITTTLTPFGVTVESAACAATPFYREPGSGRSALCIAVNINSFNLPYLEAVLGRFPFGSRTRATSDKFADSKSKFHELSEPTAK